MKELPPSNQKAWPEIERTQVADCRIFTLERSLARSPYDDKPYTFHRIVSVDWAQILPITADEEAVLVRQYRHGSREVTLEMPGGLIDAGEEPVQAALRECLEETGYRATQVRPLGVVWPNPAFMSNRLFSFYATGVVPERAIQNEGSEHTEVVLVPVADLEELLLKGRIDHALVAGAIWRFLALRERR